MQRATLLGPGLRPVTLTAATLLGLGLVTPFTNDLSKTTGARPAFLQPLHTASLHVLLGLATGFAGRWWYDHRLVVDRRDREEREARASREGWLRWLRRHAHLVGIAAVVMFFGYSIRNWKHVANLRAAHTVHNAAVDRLNHPSPPKEFTESSWPFNLFAGWPFNFANDITEGDLNMWKKFSLEVKAQDSINNQIPTKATFYNSSYLKNQAQFVLGAACGWSLASGAVADGSACRVDFWGGVCLAAAIAMLIMQNKRSGVNEETVFFDRKALYHAKKYGRAALMRKLAAEATTAAAP